MLSQVQSLQRALSLLTILAERPGLSLGELGKAADLHPATTRRLLATLAEQGCIYQSSATRRYYLGGQLMYLGEKAAAKFPFREAARTEMEKLAEFCHETIYLAVLQGSEVLYIEVVDGSQSVRMTTGIGDRCPAHTTATGRVLVSYLSEDRLASYLNQNFTQRTQWTTTDPARLREIIVQTRQAGVNVTVDEEVEGITSFAAPVIGPDGNAMAAIGVAVPTYRLSDGLATEMLQRVPYHAQRVSAHFSGRGGTSTDSNTPNRDFDLKQFWQTINNPRAKQRLQDQGIAQE